REVNAISTPRFQLGDHVRVGDAWFVEYQRGATGRIALPPAGLQGYSGHFRRSAPFFPDSKPEAIIYRVEFDQPLHEIDGDAPSVAGEISEDCLSEIVERDS